MDAPPAADVLAADPWLAAKWSTAAGSNSDHLHAISILVSNVECPHIQSYVLSTLLPTGASLLHEVIRQLSLQYLPAQASLIAEITSLSWSSADDTVQTFFRRLVSLFTQYRQLLALTKEAGTPDPVGFDDTAYLQLILNAIMPFPFAQAITSLVNRIHRETVTINDALLELTRRAERFVNPIVTTHAAHAPLCETTRRSLAILAILSADPQSRKYLKV